MDNRFIYESEFVFPEFLSQVKCTRRLKFGTIVKEHLSEKKSIGENIVPPHCSGNDGNFDGGVNFLIFT